MGHECKCVRGDIGWAVEQMRQGALVTRPGWNGKGMWLRLWEPTEDSDMTVPYVYMRTADGSFIPWICSQADLLADDWVFADGFQ